MPSRFKVNAPLQNVSLNQNYSSYTVFTFSIAKKDSIYTSALPLCVLAMSTTTACSLAFILSAAMLEVCRWGHCNEGSRSSQKFCDVMDPGEPWQPSAGEWFPRCCWACAQGGSCLEGPCCEMVTFGWAMGDRLIPELEVVMAPTLAQCGGDSGDGDLGECLFGGNEWCTCTTGP